MYIILKFDTDITDPLGPATFVIMDTDYDNSALLCTCQDKKFFFDFLTFHRRSCTILERSPVRDSSVTSKVRNILSSNNNYYSCTRQSYEYIISISIFILKVS